MYALKRIFRPIYAPILRRIRVRAKTKAQQAAIRAQVKEFQSPGAPLKVIIGAGSTRFLEWIATDIPAFNVLSNEHWSLLFAPRSIDRLLAEHVFEHFTTRQFAHFLRLSRQYLAPGGRIRFAVPDGFHPDPSYIERVRPGGTGQGADDHKVLYTCDKIAELLDEANYDFQLLEYFDVEGQFHRIEWKSDDGYIGRSAEHDERNSAGHLAYTSLIVDCWPRT